MEQPCCKAATERAEPYRTLAKRAIGRESPIGRRYAAMGIHGIQISRHFLKIFVKFRPVSILFSIFTKRYNLRKSTFFYHISAENVYLRAVQKVITMDQLFV